MFLPFLQTFVQTILKLVKTDETCGLSAQTTDTLTNHKTKLLLHLKQILASNKAIDFLLPEMSDYVKGLLILSTKNHNHNVVSFTRKQMEVIKRVSPTKHKEIPFIDTLCIILYRNKVPVDVVGTRLQSSNMVFYVEQEGRRRFLDFKKHPIDLTDKSIAYIHRNLFTNEKHT